MLATHLTRLGHQVKLVGPGGAFKRRQEQYAYPVDRWFRLPLVGKEQSWRFHLYKTKLLNRFDIIHAHTSYPTGYMAVTMKNFLKVPIVITPHGHDINLAPEIGLGMRLDPVINEKIRTALLGADAVTAISDQVAQSITDVGLPSEKITPISNGVDIDRFSATTELNIREKLQIPQQDRIVVTVGNYRPIKGHEVLIDAVRKLRKDGQAVSLVIIGAPSAELVNAAQASGEDTWLKFAGTIGLPQKGQADVLAAILQAADAYVSASINNSAEGMSLATLEAMAAGCAVVATNVSGNSDLLQQGAYGVLVEPNNSGAIATALNHMFDSNEESARLQAAAAKRARDFSWEQITKQYVALYQRVLCEHSIDGRDR